LTLECRIASCAVQGVTPPLTRLQFTAGYSLIYWSKVARAGDQVDTSVNTTQQSGGTLTGNPNPRFPYAFTDFWAQGANLGLEYKF
jgi:hypothetical protein